MPNCPRCGMVLRTIRQREGIYFYCDGCRGRSVTLPQIRRVAGDRFVTQLLRQINHDPNQSDVRCPFCAHPMRRLQSEAPVLELDACKPCGAVWFDAAEFEAVPEGASESTDQLLLRGHEALAQEKNRRLREQEQQQSDGMPDEGWKALPAFFGLPVESETTPLSRRPWLTWSTAAVIVLVSVLSFSDLRSVVQNWGLIPAQLWRHGGLTLASSFFLHGGIWHLVGNVYFLLVFGDNVEDYLGRWRWLALLVAASLLGDTMHVLFEPRSTMPCVGASGGISGLIVFYALAFPRARLSFMWRYWLYFRWIGMPAWVALVLWLLLQSWGAYAQFMGFSHVSATAHLGGAGVGFLAWLAWHRTKPLPDGG